MTVNRGRRGGVDAVGTVLLAAGLLTLVAAAGSAQEQPPAATFLHTRIESTVLVLDPPAAADRISAWAEQRGGYFLERSDAQVVVRFPGNASTEFHQFLAQIAEVVIDYAPAATDLRQELQQVSAAIASREQIVELTLGYLADSDVAATLALEREINQLLGELEQLRARANRIAVDRALVRATVVLRAQQQSIPERRPSSFAWINTVDLYGFLDAMRRQASSGR